MSVSVVLGVLVSALAAGENWPCFRGPGRQGISGEKNVPVKWSAAENVAWKTAIDGEGWSSPIIFGDRVFVTAATDKGASFRLVALDRKTGRVLWNTEVFRQKTDNKMTQNSYASATPATDGKRVYVLAADGSIGAVSMAGEKVWEYRQFEYYSQHGLGVSPVLYDGLVIVPFDWSSRGPEKKVGWQIAWDQSFIVALNADTGKEQWRAKRGLSRIAHVTPQIVETGTGVELVSAAGDVLQGFDLKTGELLWTATSPGEGVVPSVVAGEGLVFSTTGFNESWIRAVRPGGRGDVTETHTVWRTDQEVPHIPSLLYVAPNLYSLTETGVMQCLEAKTGKEIWRDRLGGRFSASPVWAEGRVYVLSEKGVTTVIAADGSYKVVAENDIGEKCCASPAISQGCIFIRSEQNLYCVGRP
jgi:hypothetical protein